MASIGPQMPSHLTKRKRSNEPDIDSPPSKLHQRHNEAEINLDDDSDDDFGPSSAAVQIQNSTARVSGPSLPTIQEPQTYKSANQDEITLDEDSDDDAGPSLPAARTGASPPRQVAGPSLPNHSHSMVTVEPRRRVMGPAMPPLADLPSPPPLAPPEVDADSDSDPDSYGPSLPSHTSHSTSQPSISSMTTSHSTTTATAPPPSKRDDWMLAPPPPSSTTGPRAPDPTKLKARKFASGPRAGGGGSGEISSIWTETPEQRAKRLKDAVLGRTIEDTLPQRNGQGMMRVGDGYEDGDDAGSREPSKPKGRSLYEEHQAKMAAEREGKGVQSESSRCGGGDGGGTASGRREGSSTKNAKGEEEDDPSKRAFDREKDMAISNKIGRAQRRELLNKASNFGGRFQKSQYS